ncbi:MAG: hypothetical protein ACLS7Z_10860 [Christensenellales bacterium]
MDSVHTFVTGLSSYTDGVSQAAQGRLLCTPARGSPTAPVQLSDGTAQLADGLDALKQTLNADVLPLLNGDVQKALDVFENTRISLPPKSALT